MRLLPDRSSFVGRLLVGLTPFLQTVLIATIQPAGKIEAQERFAVIGDFGDTTAATNVANRLKSMKPNWITTVGDNIYTTGGTTAEFDAAIGIKYGSFIKGSAGTFGTATVNNFYPTLGNHDIDAGGGSFSQNYTDYFNLTSANDVSISPSSGNERYYDVVRGDVHLFVLSSDTRDTIALGGGQAIGSPQRTWFENALAGSTSRWNVVVAHHPSYSTASASGNLGSNPYMQWGFASGGNKAQVIYNGHAHTYERALATATGQQYVVEGSGGQSTGNFAIAPLTGAVETQFRDTSNPSTINAQGGKPYNGFSIVDANDTHFTHKHFQQNGDLLDDFTLPADGLILKSTAFSNGNPSGYVGARDTQLSQSAPNNGFGSSAGITVDAADGSGLPSQILLRFDDIFGSGSGQVPFDSEIALATLHIEVTNAGSGLNALRMLTNWQDNATWNSMIAGVSADGIEAVLASDFDVTIGTADAGESAATNVGLGTLVLDVTKSVQAWSNGDPNYGWLLSYLDGGTNGIGFRSSEDTTPSLRPRLEIDFISAIPEPLSCILTAFALSIAGRFRANRHRSLRHAEQSRFDQAFAT